MIAPGVDQRARIDGATRLDHEAVALVPQRHARVRAPTHELEVWRARQDRVTRRGWQAGYPGHGVGSGTFDGHPHRHTGVVQAALGVDVARRDDAGVQPAQLTLFDAGIRGVSVHDAGLGTESVAVGVHLPGESWRVATGIGQACGADLDLHELAERRQELGDQAPGLARAEHHPLDEPLLEPQIDGHVADRAQGVAHAQDAVDEGLVDARAPDQPHAPARAVVLYHHHRVHGLGGAADRRAVERHRQAPEWPQRGLQQPPRRPSAAPPARQHPVHLLVLPAARRAARNGAVEDQAGFVATETV